MTQNGFVWRRWSELKPTSEGMIRNWPRLRDLRTMLAASGFSDVRSGACNRLETGVSSAC